MRKIMIALLIVLTFAVGCTNSNTNAAAVKDQATWVWNPWALLEDEAGVLAFLQEKGINKVYLQIDRDIPVKVYRSFIEKAAAKGMRVYALDGASDWVAPKGYISQNQLMNWLNTYQKGSKSTQKFVGIHLDVEPYLYEGWSTNQAATVKSYQDLLIKAKVSAASLQLPLEVDMPFWFDEISYKNAYGKGILAEWVISQTSSVTIMAYRDSAAGINDIVKNEIALANKYKKSIVVGVETGETGEGDQISFFEEGEVYMKRQLKAVQSKYTQAAGFKGIAVHSIESWEQLSK